MIADNPDDRIDLKSFHAAIQNDHDSLKREQDAYQPIPQFKQIQATHVQQNYLQIKEDIENIIFSQLERMGNDPELSPPIVRKN